MVQVLKEYLKTKETSKVQSNDSEMAKMFTESALSKDNSSSKVI